MLRIIVVVLAMSFIYSQSLAQGMPPSIQIILKQTMSADGYLTKQMHKEFWTEINSIANKKERTRLKNILEINFLYAQEYQKELWLSAKQSHIKRKVIKTQRLIEIEKQLPIKFEKSLPFPKESANYRSALRSYNESTDISMENSKRLLRAAATHQPMSSAQGQVLIVDLALIDKVLSNLNLSFSRLNNLINENWQPK